MNRSANSAALRRKAWTSFTERLSTFISLSSACSIGRPWQSQPGTYGARRPRSAWALTVTSFRILFKAWPMWMCPFA